MKIFHALANYPLASLSWEVMTDSQDYLALDEEALLRQCDLHTYKSSGPGGQHRNKVSSAVRVRHRPTGISAHGDDSRSQSENKLLAIRRLRMNIACQFRRSTDMSGEIPPYIRQCMFVARGGDAKGSTRLKIGAKDFRFWHVASFLLDLLDASQGQLATAATWLGITTSNFVGLLQSERHLLAAAQEIRKKHGLKPLV